MKRIRHKDYFAIADCVHVRTMSAQEAGDILVKHAYCLDIRMRGDLQDDDASQEEQLAQVEDLIILFKTGNPATEFALVRMVALYTEYRDSEGENVVWADDVNWAVWKFKRPLKEILEWNDVGHYDVDTPPWAEEEEEEGDSEL